MFDSDSVWAAPVQTPDPSEAQRALGCLMQQGQAAGRTLAERARNGEALAFDPSTGLQAMAQLSMSLMTHPMKALELQARAGRDFLELWQGTARRALGQEVEPTIAPS